MKKLAVIALLLLSGITKAQVYVSKQEKEMYIRLSFLLMATNVWKRFMCKRVKSLLLTDYGSSINSNGFVVAKYKYKDGDLVSVSMFVNQHFNQTNLIMKHLLLALLLSSQLMGQGIVKAVYKDF